MDQEDTSRCSRLKARLKPWFFATSLDAAKLRGALIGAVISITIGQVSVYRLLRQHIRIGDLPLKFNEWLILGLAASEILIAPLVGWLGLICYHQRRALLTATALVGAVSTLLWFALPSVEVPESVGFCSLNHTIIAPNNTVVAPESNSGASLRITIIIYTYVVFGLSQMIYWSHGIGFIAEQAASKLSMHYGILVCARLIFLNASYKIMSEMVETQIVLQIMIIFIGLLVSAFQFFTNIPKRMPDLNTAKPAIDDGAEMAPFIPRDDKPTSVSRGFFATTGRVFFNPLAMSQIVAMSLMTTALWGFAFYQNDILKAKYNLFVPNDPLANNADMFRFLAIVLAVVFVGIVFAPPMMSRYNKTRVLTHVARMAVVSIILYLVITLALACDKGYVAGLEENSYKAPECSQNCGCVPQWQEYSPVCVVDNMTTYLSPCHAGCMGTEELGGVRVYSNCTCGVVSGRAVSGACSDAGCGGVYQLHLMLYALLLVVSGLAFQSQGVVTLNAVGLQDKSTALGVCCAFVAAFTFVCGSLFFSLISAGTCLWHKDGRCHLQSTKFPLFVGVACAGLVFFSFIITLVTVIFTRRMEKSGVTDRTDDAELTQIN